MQREPQQSVWDWYQQFSHDPADEDQRLSRNFFRRATQDELSAFRDEFGDILPETYEKFLLEIGSGYLRQDLHSKITIYQYNEFLSLKEISSILGGAVEGRSPRM